MILLLENVQYELHRAALQQSIVKYRCAIQYCAAWTASAASSALVASVVQWYTTTVDPGYSDTVFTHTAKSGLFRLGV
jgi:hypothetical protein